MQLHLPYFSEPRANDIFPQNKPLQVTQLFENLNNLLKQNGWTRQICVLGEVSSAALKNGVLFFDLKDQNFDQKGRKNLLRCRLFSYDVRSHGTQPRDGDILTVYGSLNAYGPQSNICLLVNSFTRGGQGELLARLEQLKEKLRREHLFDSDRKRRLPSFPRVVGLITSQEGKAFGDVQKVFRERAPHVRLWLVPALVQGSSAPASMIAALRFLERLSEVDVIILGRGGGSSDDLMAFNDEGLVRAVAACSKPIVTAIGHNGDNSLCDLAADVIASTPTYAAEYVVPSRSQLSDEVAQHFRRARKLLGYTITLRRQEFDGLRRRCALSSPQQRLKQDNAELNALNLRLLQISRRLTGTWRHQLDLTRQSPGWRYPPNLIAQYRQELEKWQSRAENALLDIISKYQNQLDQYLIQLQAFDPRQALQRGYALVSGKNGEVVTSVRHLVPGDPLTVSLSDGQVVVSVQNIISNRKDE